MAALKKKIARLEDELSELRVRLEGAEEIGCPNDSTAKVERAKRELESIIDAISDPIFMHDKDLKIIRANRAYKVISGMDYQDIIGQPYYKIYPQMDSPFNICLHTVESAGSLIHEEKMSLSSQGKILKIRSFPIRGDAGEYLYSIHILEDITEQEKALQRELILYNLSRRLIADIHLDYRFREICKMLVEIGYKMAWIGVLREDSEDIIPVVQAGCSNECLRPEEDNPEKPVLELEAAVASIKNRQPEIRDHRHEGNEMDIPRKGVGRRICKCSGAFPIIYEDEVLGVLNVCNKDGVFQERDIMFLQSFVSQCGVYIKNARLFEDLAVYAKQVEEEVAVNKALLELSEAISTISEKEDLLIKVAMALQKVVNAERCQIFLWNRKEGRFLPAHHWAKGHGNKPFHDCKFTPDMPLIESILKGENVFIHDVFSSGVLPRKVVRKSDIRSALYVPIKGREGVIGFIAAYRMGAPMPFQEKEEQFLNGVAKQIAVVLDNIGLYRGMLEKAIDSSQKMETLKVIHEIDKEILSTIEGKDVIETITPMISRVIPADIVTVMLVDKERGGIKFVAGSGLPFMEMGEFIPFGDTCAKKVVTTGASLFTDDLFAEKKLLPLEMAFINKGIHSHMTVPMVVKGEVMGLLNVGSMKGGIFNSYHLTTLEGLASQIAVALENSRLIGDLKKLLLSIIKTLSTAIDAKSHWTAGHSERVTMITLAIARQMGMDDKSLKDLELAGLLHDIGKIGTYDNILDKPDKLTEEEIKIAQQHPVIGTEILAPIKQLKDILPVIRHHHEFFNGEGYPDGLRGSAIPLLSRIIAVADTVDAMAADRPYRRGLSMDVITEELIRCSGSQFDPEVVKAFLKVKDQVKDHLFPHLLTNV